MLGKDILKVSNVFMDRFHSGDGHFKYVKKKYIFLKTAAKNDFGCFEILRICAQVQSGVDEVHTAGEVHPPDNLLSKSL